MSYAPFLTSHQIERIRQAAKEQTVAMGEVLYNPGDDTPPVFIVISGKIQISALAGRNEEVVTTYGPGQFSGELLMIAGRQSIYRCKAIEDGKVLRLPVGDLRNLIAKDAELNETFMKAFLARRLSLREAGHGNVVVVGSRHSAKTLELREFLTRDGHPFRFLDLDRDSVAQDLLDSFGVSINDVPVVICNGVTVLKSPSMTEVADSLGFNSNINQSDVRDLVIVGAGPAGLSTAVYAASEGVDVLVIERGAPGGQAGASSKIENYLGFPTGLSGHELASRAIAQAEKFGAEIMVARQVTKIMCGSRPYKLVLSDGNVISARVVVLATGAQYNKPQIANLDDLNGKGIYYNATFMEAQACAGEAVIVIGAGNSAGQAAVFLSQHASSVTMLVRAESLVETMSRYLIQRIEQNPKIRVYFLSEIQSVKGGDHLEEVSWMEKPSKTMHEKPIRHVFVMAGALPKTEWLSNCACLDEKGFVVTGAALRDRELPIPWPLERQPYALESSLPGVFVVGDARSGNVKRVASAVGEGSLVLNFIHDALATP